MHRFGISTVLGVFVLVSLVSVAVAQQTGCQRRATFNECVSCSMSNGWPQHGASGWCRDNWRGPGAKKKS